MSGSDADMSPERGEHRRHIHQRRSRRSSDPSSNRPHTPSKHRRRHRNASRSPSLDRNSDDIEVLPDRFDREGKPLNDHGFGGLGGGSEHEMIERLVTGFGEVIEGRSSWKDLLSGVLEESGGSRNGMRRR